MGVWGSGIAVEFKKRYPFAYQRYHDYCQSSQKVILGTANIFSNYSYTSLSLAGDESTSDRIGCLFTSYAYGTKKDSVYKIRGI